MKYGKERTDKLIKVLRLLREKPTLKIMEYLESTDNKPATQSQLGKVTGIHVNSIQRVVTLLMDEGFLEVVPQRGTKRKHYSLTYKIKDLYLLLDKADKLLL